MVFRDEKFDTTGADKIKAVNLSHKKTIESDATADDAIENIVNGGVSLIEAPAKNFKNVKKLVNPSDYYPACYFEEQDFWRKAVKGFNHVTEYDADITKYLSEDTITDIIPE